MSRTQIEVNDALSAYITQVSLRDQDLFRKLREETAALPNATMQISPEQGQFMRLLIQAIGARKALEIGVFTGYSSLSVALALPPNGKLIACDVNDSWTSIARRYWAEAGVGDKVELLIGPALNSLDKLLAGGHEGTFDFAFIDADKSNYAHYYERALRLVRRGGVIALDNMLWHGAVIDPSKQDDDTVAIRSLNLAIRDDSRVNASLLPIGDGLLLAVKL
ncbi:MAG TPA: class I SAM-dependent methyltransferase [Bryobacteraceae bacterium]|nr:class I SAM-dependent methyltransferase [Bryobacteraceae bacterium]